MVGTFSKLSSTSKMFKLEEKYFTDAKSVFSSGCVFTHFTSVYSSVGITAFSIRVEMRSAMRMFYPILHFILHQYVNSHRFILNTFAGLLF